MPSGITIRRNVEFAETDMFGIVHFSNFFRYMEATESALFPSLGITFGMNDVGWPRVHADFDFKGPLRYEDTVEIALIVLEKRPRSLVYGVNVRKVVGANAEEVASGTLIVTCVKRDRGTGAFASVPIPVEIASLIESP